jgi:hypothetical protein
LKTLVVVGGTGGVVNVSRTKVWPAATEPEPEPSTSVVDVVVMVTFAI